MDVLFLTKVVLSFIAGGFFVAFSTTIAQRYGSTVGGVIGGFPTNPAVSLFFIGYVDSAEAASHATNLIPLVVGINGLFLIVFYLFAQNGFLKGLGAAICFWFGLSMLPWIVQLHRFDVALVCYIVILCISYFVFEVLLDVRCYRRRNAICTPLNLVLRAIGCGTIISSAVVLSQLVGPTFGGIFSVFPVVFISTLVIAHYTQGIGFARSLTKPLMLSGMINVPAYAIAVRYLYPLAGLAWGTLLSLMVAITTLYCTYRITSSRRNGLWPFTRTIGIIKERSKTLPEGA